MSTCRRYVTAVGVVLCACGLAMGVAEEARKAVSYVGEITGDDVYVRSGPSLNYYEVTKLSAGNRVTVVAEENGWVAIVPPAGCYSVIDATYVDRDRGNTGVVNGNRVNVRAGSALNQKKYAIQLQLDKGAEVEVLGETEDGFVKVVPPETAKLWVHGDFVARVPEALLKMESKASSAPVFEATIAQDRPGTEKSVDPAVPVTEAAAGQDVKADRPAPDLSLTPEERQAKGEQLREQLKSVEAELKDELSKPLFTRDLTSLIARYRGLSEQTIDEYTRAYAQARVGQLSELADTIAAVGQIQQIRTSLADDRREFATGRAKIRTVPPRMDGTFDAQGELRESAIYNSPSGPRRYRLIDPEVDAPRTVCYVEIPPESGIDVAEYLGRLVGIRARGKYLKTDGVDPVPIVSAAEVVLLDRAGATVTVDTGAAAKDTTQASAEEP